MHAQLVDGGEDPTIGAVTSAGQHTKFLKPFKEMESTWRMRKHFTTYNSGDKHTERQTDINPLDNTQSEISDIICKMVQTKYTVNLCNKDAWDQPKVT